MLKTTSITIYYFVITSTIVYMKVDWEYTLITFDMKSSDTNIVEPHFRPIKVSRGVYAVNGTGKVKIDLDDNFVTSLEVFRSVKGNNQYVLTPFRFPRTPARKFVNSYYKQYIMNSVHSCSNLPFFEGEWEKPFPANEYYAKNCLISNDNLPSRVQEGYYKFIGKLSTDNSVIVEAVAVIKVENKV